MKALRVFYISFNMIKDWTEFMRMGVPPNLSEITFVGNPLNENMDQSAFTAEAVRRLPNMKKLDGSLSFVRKKQAITVVLYFK